jgi:surface antigen
MVTVESGNTRGRAHRRMLAVIVSMTIRLGGLLAVQVSSVQVAAAGVDDYPSQWRNVPQDSVLDTWREHNRECTSFVARRLHSRNGFEMPFYLNADRWGPDASSRGYQVNRTPAVGSVAWWSGMDHVAWVESVNTDGTVPSKTTITTSMAPITNGQSLRAIRMAPSTSATWLATALSR